MIKRFLPLIVFSAAMTSVGLADQKHSAPPPTSTQKASPGQRVKAADLELVKRVFQTESSRPMDWDGKGDDSVDMGELGMGWQSYWWDGTNALYNTSGLVITGSPEFSEKWKPFALIGLEDQVTFERHGKKRQGHIGLGVEYFLNDSVALFSEFRAVATSGLPTEGIGRAGIHIIY